MPKCVSYHKANGVINGRAHCFHDDDDDDDDDIYIYIYICIYIFIYIKFIYYNFYLKLVYKPRILFRRSNRLSYQVMSSTRTQSQFCIATAISSSVQCQVSLRLLPSSVATFILIELFWR